MLNAIVEDIKTELDTITEMIQSASHRIEIKRNFFEMISFYLNGIELSFA